MNKLKQMLGTLPDKTHFQKGKEDAIKGKAPPSFPTPDSAWADKLYFSGYKAVLKVEEIAMGE